MRPKWCSQAASGVPTVRAMSNPEDVVVVAGPTAAGKTALALELAERFDGEIVNADSMQVYRGMDVGTAKPSLEERTRIPHHLLDVVTPDVQYNAGRFAEEARAAAERIRARGKRVFLVGGTGLYVRAFLEGFSARVPRNTELRAELEREDERRSRGGEPHWLHARLAELDPASADRLHPNDRVRLIRAIELAESTGRPASEQRERAEPRDRVLHLVLDPGTEELKIRIDARCEAMIDGGLLQEVRNLREEGYGPELPSMRAIGYRHLQPVVDGVEILANVVGELKKDTRQFARRQRTWLRGVANAEWFHPDEADSLLARVTSFLVGSDGTGPNDETPGADREGRLRASQNDERV